MPVSPWFTIKSSEPQREYLALLTYLPLRSYRSIPRFLLYTFRVVGQLKRTPGLIGYSLWAELGKKQFWTLSAWENDQALSQFVPTMPHGEVMRKLDGKMGHTGFWRWKVKGSELPLQWREGLQHRQNPS